MIIQNLKRLQGKLKKLQQQAIQQTNQDVVVGYTASYAMYVHENTEMVLQGEPRASGIGVYWGPHGQAKFLEAPARELKRELGTIIASATKKGVPIQKALLTAGLRLQRESQKRVPVEHGNLKASAFTRLE